MFFRLPPEYGNQPTKLEFSIFDYAPKKSTLYPPRYFKSLEYLRVETSIPTWMDRRVSLITSNVTYQK